MNNFEYNVEKEMIEKSISSFLLGLEIYSKPTIKHRIEVFSFFIVNAWELMLKAKMLKDGKSICFKDTPTRALSIEYVINEVYPNKTQPLRVNLEKIVIFRNINTHFITEDYETVYAPLFQANILAFCEQLKKFHDQDITANISKSFFILSENVEPLTDEQIRSKYPPEIATVLLFQKNDIQAITELHRSDEFSMPIQHSFYQVKLKGKASLMFKRDKDDKTPVNMITQYKGPSKTHTFSRDNLIIEVANRLERQKIEFSYSTTTEEKKAFNGYILGLFIRFYEMNENEEFAFNHVVGKSETYTYSLQAAKFIVNEIQKSPHTIVEMLKKGNNNDDSEDIEVG